MRRLLLLLSVLVVASAAAVLVWVQSAEGGLVKVSDEEKAAAAASGEGARDLEVEAAAEVAFPTLQELERVADRGMVEAWAAAAAEAREAAGEDVPGDLLVLSAELERLLGNLELARELAERGARALPTNSQARLVLANVILSGIERAAAGKGVAAAILGSIGPAKAMKAELEVALELDPNNHGARVRLAGMKAFLPFPFKSMRAARKLVAGIEEYDPYLRRFWEGQLLIAQKKQDDALAAYRDLLQERPGDPDVVGSIGELLLEAGRFEEAAAEYDRLTDALDTPRGYDALYGAAKAREGGGFELEEALAMLRTILEDRPVGDLIPSADRIRFHEGNLLAALGRREEARAAYRAGLEAAPGTDRLQEALATVE